MHKQIWIRWFLKNKFISKNVRPSIFLILSFIVPIIIYNNTLLPTVGFWDTGEFQTIAYTFDIGHPTGYPTYILIGKIYLTLFNLGSIAWRMNLLSALFVSIGLFFVSLIINKWTKNIVLSTLLPILLGVSPYLWSIAIRADPHSMHFLFLTVFLYLADIILRNFDYKYLPLLSFWVGISLGNHMLSVFYIPAFLLIFIFLLLKGKKVEWHTILLSFLLSIAGVSVYLILPIISSLKDPLTINYSLTTLENFKKHVLGEDFQGLMAHWAKGNLNESIKYYIYLLNNTFPSYIWIFSIAGFIVSLKYNLKNTIINLTLFISTVYFSLRYQNASIERYFITSFVVIILWLAMYLGQLLKKHSDVYIKTLVYFFVLACIFLTMQKNYSEINQSKNAYAYDWAIQALSDTSHNSILFSWWSYSTPLWYLQRIENYRTDVKIINTGSSNWEVQALEYIKNNDVYFIDPLELQDKNYRIERQVNIYKLIKN